MPDVGDTLRLNLGDVTPLVEVVLKCGELVIGEPIELALGAWWHGASPFGGVVVRSGNRPGHCYVTRPVSV